MPNSIAHAFFARRKRLPPIFIALFGLTALGLRTVSNDVRLQGSPALDSADFIAATVCHRLPTHSFSILDRALPLCARCSGIYLGIVLMFTFAWFFGRWRDGAYPKRSLLFALMLLFGSMAIDGLNSLSYDIGTFYLYQPRNWLRLVTGMAAGIAMGAIVIPAFAQSMWQTIRPSSVLRSFEELIAILFLAAALILLLLSNQPTILYVLGVASAIGVAAILCVLYTVLVVSLFRRDGQAASWRHAILPITAGLIVTFAQVMFLATVRLQLTGTLAGF